MSKSGLLVHMETWGMETGSLRWQTNHMLQMWLNHMPQMWLNHMPQINA